MPAHPVFSPSKSHLSLVELHSICSNLVAMGISEIRLTGGEPTLRSDFQDILRLIAPLPLTRKGITSNGQLLARHLECAKDYGWTSLNISLDSLDEGRFDRITGGGDFRKVMHSIEKAAQLGFEVKINAVIMRGINDDEIQDFADWSCQTGLEVRFLELMKIGPAIGRHRELFLSADDMIDQLVTRRKLTPVPVHKDSTSMVYSVSGGGRLGFIASESKPFCGDCSRLRLTHTGVLRSCLLANFGIPLRNVPESQYHDIVTEVVAGKPLSRIEKLAEPMHAIGG